MHSPRIQRPALSVLSVGLAVALLALSSCGAPRQVTDPWPKGGTRKAGTVRGDRQVGLWTYRHAGGAKEAEGTWAKDKQHGDWTWWYENGQVKQRGAYRNALRHGPWQYFYDSGTLFCAGSYDEEFQQGIWTYHHPNGALSATGAFERGARALVWTRYDEAGTPSEQGTWFEGLRVGPWTTFNADGSIKAVEDRGCPPGYQAYREPAAGQVRRWGLLEDQRPVGPWVVFNERGLASGARLALPRAVRLMAWDGKGMPIVPALATGGAAASADARLAAIVSRLDAPLVEATAPAPVAKLEPLASTGSVRLSPLAVLPAFWTKREEANAAGLIAQYATGDTSKVSYKTGFSHGELRQRQDLLGRPLAQTRLLSSTGEVIDLADQAGRKHVVLVILRGFAGQVCIYCSTQTAAITQARARFAAQDAEILLVYPGPAESVPSFLAAVQSLGVQPELPIALDVDLQLVRGLRVEDELAKPTSIILDKSGAVRYAYMGASMADRPSVDDLLKALGGLNRAQGK